MPHGRRHRRRLHSGRDDRGGRGGDPGGGALRVLVIGNGGREHALCWLIGERSPETELYCAPGSPGTEECGESVALDVTDIDGLARFAAERRIDLAVVGPEVPLSLGVVDAFRERGLAIFGPTRAAARLESSKVLAKEFMRRHGVPTCDFEVTGDRDAARRAAERFGLPAVLKADGLAAGKGVLIVSTLAELEAALDGFFVERRFGDAGDRILIEPFVPGEEVSFIGFCDGRRVLPLATSKDYKRVGDGDSGPNTGGMGAHSPAGIVSDGEVDRIMREVMEPTVAGMAAEGTPFSGVLYAGLMMSPDGPQVLEFNTRLGDPEAQALLLRLDEDPVDLFLAGAGGDFGRSQLAFRAGASACLVLANRGYPGKASSGDLIEGIEDARACEGVVVFHAGTGRNGGAVTATGGRVLNVCAVGEDLGQALERAYGAAALIRWPSKAMRSDIGRRVLDGGAGVGPPP
ncbi:MAG: phosphoribosylamine--glycine ligase [Acidobacteria bacterium]|nr:phosphoribosylamine--glycine ligase [Acidobacteriota bacterium]